jgi:drug/metabolite transporter (DMT)-like permease
MIMDHDTSTQANNSVPPPRPPSWHTRAWAVIRSVAAGLMLWLGEAVIGVLPLGAVELVGRFRGSPVPAPIAEVCILSVVISGLSLLPLLRFGPHQRPHRMTAVSYILALITLVALMAGALMYGLAVTDIAHGDTGLAYLDLKVALAASLLLALEAAILDA